MSACHVILEIDNYCLSKDIALLRRDIIIYEFFFKGIVEFIHSIFINDLNASNKLSWSTLNQSSVTSTLCVSVSFHFKL